MNTDSITIRVLVVDDQPSDVELLKHGFASAGGNVDVVHIGDAGRAKTFVSLLAPFAFDLIVLDWNLGGTQAEDIAEAYFLKTGLASSVPLVVMSGLIRDSTKAKLVGKGAIVREKPFSLEGYRKIGVELLGLSRAHRSNAMPILERLKLETAAVHAELEQRVDLLNRVRSAEAYRNLLETFFGLYFPLEAEVYAANNGLGLWLTDVEERKRAESIRKDLSVLGITDPDALPLAPVPTFSTVAAKFGCAYVLEGSTLGGQTIARHVREHLGFTADHGCAFFSSHGPKLGEMWKQFRESVESFAAAHPERSDEIVQSARATFHAFHDWSKEKLI